MKPKIAIPRIYWGTKRDFVLLGIAVFSWFSLCAGAWLIISNFRVKSDFCQSTDQLYQFVVAHSDEWGEHFSSIDQGYAADGLQVHTPEGKKIEVFSDYYKTPDGKPIMYVSSILGWPDTPKGYAGYLIIPTGSPPEWWQDWYYLQPMSDQIFCYSESDWTSF